MLRSKFLQAVQFASQAVSTRSTLPILDTLRIKATAGVGEVCGTNLDLFASHTFPCDVDLECCVAAGRLKRVLAAIDADSIGVSFDGAKLTIDGDGRFTFDTLPADDFPPAPEVTGKFFPIPGKAIARCINAVADVHSMPTVTGVMVDAEGAVIGADTRRMHIVTIPKVPSSFTMAKESAALLSGLEGEMCVSDKNLHAKGDGWSVIGKLIEGSQPKWRQLIPSAESTEFDIPDDFYSVIRRAAECSSDLKLDRVEFKDGKITSPGYVAESGMTERFNIAFHPTYLGEAIKQAGENAIIRYTDEMSGIVVESDGFRAVVQPIRPIVQK